ncbi:MAG: hypothetical protein INR71_15455 [Terriglobus roseus]|nr:hypothetical protein [Terriglobus roseus]
MTDLAEAQVKEMFGKEGIDFGQIIVLNLPAKDFVGFVCSKYSILDYEQFEGFQPLLYLDPDIVIDRPIEPMLAAVASSGRICAPAEGWNQVHHHVPVGASLLRMDNVECRFMPGLNGGTIGFPALDTPDVRNTIERIRRTIACLGRRFGRTFNGWADQEAMNYVAIKTDSFDSTTITPFVTHYVPSTETLGGPRGLVHFWGRTSTGKADAMANYVRSLKEHGVATAQDAHVNSGPLLYSSDDLSRGQPALPVLKLSDDETSS